MTIQTNVHNFQGLAPVEIHCVKSLAAILFILYLYFGVRQSALIFLFRLRFLLGELNHATW